MGRRPSVKRTLALLVLGISLLAIVYSAPSITILHPSNATISDSKPNLSVTTNESSNITYSWDGGGNISGCRECKAFNTTYGETLPDSSTVLLLHFNENFSTIAFDSSSYGNNGTLVGPPVWAAGKFGSALDFSGADYVSVPHSSSLATIQNFTMIVWIRPRPVDLNQLWVTILEKPGDIWGLYITGGSLAGWTQITGGVYGITPLTADTWYCAAFTRAGNFFNLYLDGTFDGIEVGTGTFTDPENSLVIGGNSGDSWFTGDIDELAVYNRPLSASEIQAFCSKSLSDGPHRVEVHIQNASGNTNSTVRYFTIDSKPPYRIDLNSPANGSRQPPNVNFSWTSYDAGSNMSSNLTIDGMVNQSYISIVNGSAKIINVSGLSAGNHSWNVTTWDDALNINTSITLYFTVDATPPAYTVFNNTPLVPSDILNVSCYSFWTDDGPLGSAVVEENATVRGVLRNYTTPVVGGWANHTIDASILEAGTVQCRIIVNDSVGNTNSTPAWTFVVSDSTPPYIRNVANVPSTADDLDPGVQVNVSANVTDFTGVDTVVLHYRAENESGWSNTTMNRISGDVISGIYRGNFTAIFVSNWSYRIFANDSSPLRNSNASAETRLAVDYDWSWTRTPSSFGTKSGPKGSNISLGNLTINNTGDFDLRFEVNASHSWIYLNFSAGTLSFNLSNKTTARIVVNASLPTPDIPGDEFMIEITIDAVNTSADPSFAITNATVISFPPGPYLKAEITDYDPTVTQGDTDITLIAKVTNWGNESANNTWLAWVLPDGWTNSSSKNKTTSSLLPQSTGKGTFTNRITVNITTSAATGTKTLTAIAGSNNTNETSASVTVTVSAAPSPAPAPTAAAGGVGPAAPTIIKSEPTYSPTPEARASLFQTLEALEVIKGTTGGIRVMVVNPIPNTTLENVTLNISGYPPERIRISPQVLSGIGHLQAGEFTVTILAPKEEGTVYTLQSILTGKLVYLDYPTEVIEGTGQVLRRKNVSADFFEERMITLVVQDETLPILAPTEEEEKTLLQTVDAIELLRGGEVVLPVKVGNPIPGTTLENLVLMVDGYPKERIDISPKSLSGIGLGEAREFKVTIKAPTFAEKGSFKLNLTLSGEILYHDYPTIVSELTGQPILKRDISLGLTRRGLVDLALHEVSRSEAASALDRAARAVEDMIQGGLRARRASRLLERAKEFLAASDYEEAKELADAIAAGRDAALASVALLGEVERDVVDAEEKRGLKTSETKIIFNLGFAAFEREDYATALERFRNARDTLALETRGKINLGKIILDNLLAVFGGIVALTAVGYLGLNYLVSIRDAGRLRSLWSEEFGILLRMRVDQARYFKEKIMSSQEYHSAMERHERRLAEIEAEKVALRSKRPLAALIHRDLESLRAEERQISNLIKETQRKYFEEKSMGRRGYDKAMAAFKARLAEVEAGIAAMEVEMETRRPTG